MYFDFFGTIFSLLATSLFVTNSKKAWPVSIIAITINSWLYFTKGIYAHLFLESFYLMSCIYGWIFWSGKTDLKNSNEPFPVFITKPLIISYTILTSTLFLTGYGLLSKYTNSNIPGLDALTTALSICAQIMMCKKIMATWIIWFVTDSLVAIIYWYKSLPFHCAMMIIYTFLAILGYLRWLSLIKHQMNKTSWHAQQASHV